MPLLGLGDPMGAVLFLLFQAALIVGLLVNRAKRRQGEAEATLIAEISSKFVNLPAGEADREIMAAERRICEFLDLDISAIWQGSVGPPGCFTLSRGDRSFRSWLEQCDLIELIEPNRFYPTNRHAAQAFGRSPECATTKPVPSAADASS